MAGKKFPQHGQKALVAQEHFPGGFNELDGIAVEVERIAEEDGQLMVDAAIWVDRDGQKPIVIGAKGERLKRVGRSARLALNGILQQRLHLNLWVKVRENWADNARALRELGLE